MKYTVVLHQTDEGFAVACPGLPGCWSQGATEAEALENIQSAIQEYLAAVRDSVADADVRQVEEALGRPGVSRWEEALGRPGVSRWGLPAKSAGHRQVKLIRQ